MNAKVNREGFVCCSFWVLRGPHFAIVPIIENLESCVSRLQETCRYCSEDALLSLIHAPILPIELVSLIK